MGKLKIGCSCLKHKVPISWTTRGCLVLKKPSLITHHSSLNFPHSSFKISQFPKPHMFGTLFSASHHSNISTFYGTHYLSTIPVYTSTFLLFFFFFSSLSPNTQTQFSLPLRPSILFLSSSPNSAELHLTEYKQRRSPAKEIHLALISTSPSVDLHRHPAYKITFEGQQRRRSPPLWPMSFLLRPPLFC